jgi:uncharacterized protein YabN with tetrapyrrole methylase and pyrophosphatase domain
MKILKICKLCNSNYYTDLHKLTSESKHNNNCPWIKKSLKNQWWKFWIKESYEYIRHYDNG